MAEINLNVKIRVGPRTKTDIEVYSTAVNGKTVTLKNGRKITDEILAKWVYRYLLNMLEKLEATRDE